VFRQTGIQVVEVDYAVEFEAVRQASIVLHRAYTGLSDGVPSRLMGGALRVVLVEPRDEREFDVRPGDLLLGASAVERTIDTEHVKLVRFESIPGLREFLDPQAAAEAGSVECWLLRDGKVHTARVPVIRVR
jgi:hypothetical protein